MNRYQRVLLFVGLGALVVGGIVALAARRAADSAEFSALLTSSLVGGYYDDSEVVAAYGWMWFGIVLAVLGVLALIGYLIVRAGQTEKAPTPAD